MWKSEGSVRFGRCEQNEYNAVNKTADRVYSNVYRESVSVSTTFPPVFGGETSGGELGNFMKRRPIALERPTLS